MWVAVSALVLAGVLAGVTGWWFRIQGWQLYVASGLVSAMIVPLVNAAVEASRPVEVTNEIVVSPTDIIIDGDTGERVNVGEPPPTVTNLARP